MLVIPEDPKVEEADNEARAPIDSDPDAPAMRAVGRLVTLGVRT